MMIYVIDLSCTFKGRIFGCR